VNARYRSIAAATAAASSAVLVVLATAQTPGARPPASPPAAARPAPPPAVATVGGTARISRDEFEARVREGLADYRQRLGADVPENLRPVVRRQILESLVRRELLVLEAARRGLQGSQAEGEALLRQSPFFNPGGRFDEARWAQARAANPQMIEQAVNDLRRQLGARMLNERLDREIAPREDEVRASATRALTRAGLDVLALRRADFSGAAPEPSEPEVVEAYRARAEEFRRPARAVLSVVALDAPEPPDPAAERARQRADSLVRALRAGGAWAAAADSFGARSGVVVTPDNFPGFWRGDARQSRAVFEADAGTVLAEPVRGATGWLVVRVDEVRPSGIAPLRDVAREVRARLRQEAREQLEERALRALFARVADSLRTTAVRLRYVALDTSRVRVPELPPAELERWYRGHLADYSSFDPATASIRARPFEEVRDDVRRRALAERRVRAARATLESIERAWRAGRRDAARERQATVLREVGPVVPGAPADTGLAGAAVGDSLALWGATPGVRTGAWARGGFVVHVHEVVANFVPSFEQARPMLRARHAAAVAAEEERGARALFDAAPARFARGDQVHFTRVLVPLREAADVPLTRDEVERYHRAHIDRYSAPEEVRARHILVSPDGEGPEADARARAEAESLLARVRAGEDFGALARQHTDDPATRDVGGDLGFFGRGAMLDAFERAVFALRPGEVSDVVRTEVGYHIIQLTEHRPAVAQPLATMWTNVGSDLAAEKADSLARRTADSLYRAVRTPAQLRAAARTLGLEVESFVHNVGERAATQDMRPVLERIESVAPGRLYPGVFSLRGMGTALAIVDSVTPARAPSWNEARARAIEAYRAGAGGRALEAKAAELDSLRRAGWSLDSLGALWGGLTTHTHAPGGSGLPGLGGGGQLDSLVAGSGERPGALAVGATSGWLRLDGGMALVRYRERIEPNATQLASRIESEREAIMNRRRWEFFEDLKKRFPVRILDAALRETSLPEPPRR